MTNGHLVPSAFVPSTWHSLQCTIWRYLITLCLPHMAISFIWPGVVSVFPTIEFLAVINARKSTNLC